MNQGFVGEVGVEGLVWSLMAVGEGWMVAATEAAWRRAGILRERRGGQ